MYRLNYITEDGAVDWDLLSSNKDKIIFEIEKHFNDGNIEKWKEVVNKLLSAPNNIADNPLTLIRIDPPILIKYDPSTMVLSN